MHAASARLEGEPLAAADAAAWWADVRDHRHPFFRLEEADAARGHKLWRIAVPAAAEPLQLDGEVFIDWAGAQRWWRTEAPAEIVRAAAAKAGGHATLFRSADKSAGVFTPLSGPLMQIQRRLKQSFDPAGIFNRGRLYPDL